MSAAGFVFRTRFVMIVGFTFYGTIIDFLIMAYSIFSMICLFHSPPATIGVPRYMSKDLPKLLMRVSITIESAYLNFHLRYSTFLFICFSTSFLYRPLSTTILKPKYFTLSLTSMPSICCTVLLPPLILMISHFLRLILRLNWLSNYRKPYTTWLISTSFFVNIVISSAYARRSFLDNNYLKISQLFSASSM